MSEDPVEGGGAAPGDQGQGGGGAPHQLDTDLLSRATFKARCSDISLSGCYLDMLNPMEPGAPISVRLEHATCVFETQARVAYTVSRLGMGVAFAEPVPAGQLLILSAWISQAAATANSQPSVFGASTR
jgi:hypothetical protein